MPSLRKALALSFASKYSSLAIHTVAVVVLARLLTPAEIGVYSVVAAVVALAHVLRDFGVGNYLEFTTERIRTALSVVVLFTWSIATALLPTRPLVSQLLRRGFGQFHQGLERVVK